MGIKKKINRFFKDNQKKELQNRANQFMAEYRVIRSRYQCDFQAYLQLVDGGEGGLKPGVRVIDITKTIESENEADRKMKERLENYPKPDEKKNGN